MRIRATNVLALLTVPAIAPAVAPFVADWHWSLDLLACFPVHAMGALWFTALVLFAARRWRLALPFACGGALAALAVVPDWCRATTVEANGPAVRIATLNLLRGAHRGLPAALAAVRAEDPDVLFCSEVTPEWLAGLADALPDLPHRCLRADPGYYGVALFSRWPLRSAAVLPLGVTWAPTIRAVVDTPHGELGVLGVHTPRPGNAERAGFLQSALAAIPATLAPLPPARVVLGDFNATPWNHGFRGLLAATGLDAATANSFRPTWPSNFPWPLRVPIDHVLVSPDVSLVAARVGEPFGSDHLPLFATIRVRTDAANGPR